MGNKKVTIGVVLFGTKYLKDSLPSLVNQDYQNIEFIFRDQEEEKYSAYEFMKKELPEVFEKVKIEKGKNLWHGGGHNAIITQMDGEIYICCSNDMWYPSDFVSKVVEALEKNPEFGFATCKLMRWDYQNREKTNFIDSVGMGITDYHHFYDLGQGEEDKGQYNDLKEVFGVSGACGIFSKKALESIRYQDEYFDSLLHYKNDVDLSYRLQWAGNRALLINNVKVYHDRQIAEKSKKALEIKKSSFFGEKVLMRKNYDNRFPLKIRVKTGIYQLIKTGYLLFSTPQLFGELIKFWKVREEVDKKKMAMKRVNLIDDIVKFF